MNEPELIKQVLDGDQDLFEKIVNKYEHKLLSYILKILNYHQQDAEDVLWITFGKVYSNLDRYNPKLSFQSWLYRISHNVAIDYSKKNRRVYAIDPDHPKVMSLTQTTNKNLSFEYNLPKILDQLKPVDKQLLVLYHLEGMRLQDLSEILSIPKPYVSVKLNRAKTKASKILFKTISTY